MDWYSRCLATGMSRRQALSILRSADSRKAFFSSGFPFLPRSLGLDLDYVVDVGANEGQWLSSLLLFVTIARVDALEPNPVTFKRLLSNMRARPQVSCHELAAGERVDRLTMHAARHSAFSSFLRPSGLVAREYGSTAAELVEEVEVAVMPLDAALAGDQVIDLLKIDVEGFQRPVLAGAKQTLARTRVVLIETYFASHFAGDETFAGLHSLMTDGHGFEFWNLALPVYGASGRAMWADAVYVNPALAPPGGWERGDRAATYPSDLVYKSATL